MESDVKCPRCAKPLTLGRQHCCDEPWIYTAPCSTAPSGKRAVRIEYVTHGFFPIAIPVDRGSAPVSAVLGQPPFAKEEADRD